MRNNRLNHNLNRHETYLILITAVIFLFFTLRTGGVFLTAGNMTDMISGVAMRGIMAAGVLVVLICGGIDISFMAVGCVAQYVTAYYLLSVEQTNLATAVVAACITGIALGLLNGFLVWLLRVPSIIVTIATMNIYYGILIWITKGKLMNNFPTWFSEKTSFGIRILPILLVISVFALTGLILNRTRLGRSIYALGGNRIAAVRLGMSPLRIHLAAYGYLGFTAALGGLLQMYLSQTVAPNTLVGNEMEVLSMVVLGGASLLGGKGTALGTLIGVLLIGAIGNGIVLCGVSSYWFDFVTGLILLVSFCVTRLGVRRNSATGKEASHEG